MSRRDHTVIEELLAVRALGGLDGADAGVLRSELAAHGDCAECRDLDYGFAEVAGRLAFALDPEPVDPAMADAILRVARDVPEERPDDGVEARDVLRVPERRGVGRRWRALVGVAAAFALIVGGYVALDAMRRADLGRVAASQRVVRFEGEGGRLAMAYEPGKPGAVLFGTGFADPGPDRVFEIWMFQGDVPISGGCLTASDGAIAATLDTDVSEAELMAVTIEPASCPDQPTTAPILTAALTPA
jgi:anti-sigma-K factor RskA